MEASKTAPSGRPCDQPDGGALGQPPEASGPGTGAAAATAVAAASGAFGARTATRKGVIMGFRTRIAIPALSAALALAAFAAPGAAQAASAAPAAQSRPGTIVPPTSSSTTTVNSVAVACYRPSQYRVNASNIHIRATPDGTILYSIAKGALVDSIWHATCSGVTSYYELYTEDQIAGQQWLHGWSNAIPSHVGWIGGAYLTFVKYCTANGC
jgi:hypothetical protein